MTFETAQFSERNLAVGSETKIKESFLEAIERELEP